MLRFASYGLAVLVLFGPTKAFAQPMSRCPAEAVGCHEEAHGWLYRSAAFDDVSLDSGWVPAGSPIQLRIVFYVGGSTEVEMGGDITTYWPTALSTAVHGRMGSGALRINYGIELAVSLRFDVTIAGVRYRWEGDLPVPGIPEDLRMAAEALFDPFLLPPSMRPVSVSDATDRVEVLRYDALGGLIPVPGVGGGIALTLMGTLDASYQTEQIVVVDALPILEEDSFTIVGPDPGIVGFGGAKDLLVHPEGTLSYDGALVVAPILYLSFAGTRRDYPLVEIPIPLVDTDVNVIFDDANVHVPLPDVDVSPIALELGPTRVGDVAEETVMVSNEGEAELLVTVREPMAPFGAAPSSFALPPRTNALLTVSYAPEVVDPESTLLVLETNDPDEPEVVLRLRGEGLAPAMPDAGPGDSDAGPIGPPTPMDGGCGCRVAHAREEGSAGLAFGLFAAFVAVSRASRRRP
jgi:hypothetical protein